MILHYVRSFNTGKDSFGNVILMYWFGNKGFDNLNLKWYSTLGVSILLYPINNGLFLYGVINAD